MQPYGEFNPNPVLDLTAFDTNKLDCITQKHALSQKTGDQMFRSGFLFHKMQPL